MNKVVTMRSGEYRLLVRAVDKSTTVLAIASAELEKADTLNHRTAVDNAITELTEAQETLESHVRKHGLPPVVKRF